MSTYLKIFQGSLYILRVLKYTLYTRALADVKKEALRNLVLFDGETSEKKA